MIGGIIQKKVAEDIYKRIAVSSEKANRKAKDITIVAVTKSFPVSAMISAYESGFTVLGESRIQETEQKIEHYPYRKNTELHLIGHLQSNKAKKAVKLYDIIETVDSLKLAKKIDLAAKNHKTTQKIFFQVNTGDDPAKFGASRDEAIDVCLQISELKNIVLEGVMVIAPFTKYKKVLSKTFADTRKIRDNVISHGIKSCTSLSMGMSGDFEIAIEEGATHTRIGTALFGSRK